MPLPPEFEQTLSAKTNEQLFEMLANADDYTPEALAAGRIEAERRSLGPEWILAAEARSEAVLDRAAVVRKRATWPIRLIKLFFACALLAIVVIQLTPSIVGKYERLLGPYSGEIKKLHIGMTRSDVIAALGKPYHESADQLAYYHHASGRMLIVVFNGDFCGTVSKHSPCGWQLIEVSTQIAEAPPWGPFLGGGVYWVRAEQQF